LVCLFDSSKSWKWRKVMKYFLRFEGAAFADVNYPSLSFDLFGQLLLLFWLLETS